MYLELKKELEFLISRSIFNPDLDDLDEKDWEEIISIFDFDYKRYYNSEIDYKKIKYFPGLLCTFLYRISRQAFKRGKEALALEFSSLGYSLTSIELYYSAEIGKGLKINHGIGTVIGSRVSIGENILLHHSVTLGEKNGGRAKLGDNVIVYPGAIIVGDVFIDDNSIIGANVFVDRSYPKNSKIF